jgi:catechol 2,3-dioxygenase-like lactoylglutathione lyase family enzyme
MTGPSLFRVILPVADIERAAAFYAQVLGFEGARISDGRHYFDCDGTILACYDATADGDEGEAKPLPEWIYFAVDDVHAVHARCREAGATPGTEDIDGTPAGEVVRRPWGEVSFYVRDPFGNGICFVERETAFTGKF